MVSLGCPKALVDSERILTKLGRTATSCRPITSRPTSSWSTPAASSIRPRRRACRDRRGDRRERAGDRHRLHGQRGGRHPRQIPRGARVTGPHQYEQVVGAVHVAAPIPPSAYLNLVPEGGLKLTPAPLQLSEDLRGLQPSLQLLHHPLDPRRPRQPPTRRDPREAEKLVAAGTKELLVISQDTSAYGVDLRHASWPYKGGEVRAHMTDLARELGKARCLGAAPLRLPLSARRPGDPADGRGPRPPLSRHPLPACLAAGPEGDEAAGQRGARARADPRLARHLPRHRHPLDLRRRLPRRDRGRFRLSHAMARGSAARPGRRLPLRAGAGRGGQQPARRGAGGGQGGALRPADGADRANLGRQAPGEDRPRDDVLIDEADGESSTLQGRRRR
jgi:hypothetical protein